MTTLLLLLTPGPPSLVLLQMLMTSSPDYASYPSLNFRVSYLSIL